MMILKEHKIFLLSFASLLILPTFLPIDAMAACAPQPDMNGSLAIERCDYIETGLSLPLATTSENKIPEDNKVPFPLKKDDQGILLKGQFTKLQYIPARQTNKEPRYRRSPPRAKIKYDQLDQKSQLTVFYQSSNKKLCKELPKGKTLEMRVYFYCCELRPNHSSPCAAGADYYTEAIQINPPR